MRDPAGRITFDGDFVFRRLNQPADEEHFLHSAFALRWVEKGLLIPYEWLDPSTIRSPRLPFVTLPSEWTTSQFFIAAKFTLDLQSEAVAEGWDLKDASAWNIVFDGLQPIFVDLLSFVPLQEKIWRAAGQFNRHFLFPLLLEQRAQMEARQCMQLWRDGVPPSTARELIGPSRFLTRYWPLMAGSKAQGTDVFKQGQITPNQHDLVDIEQFRTRLNQSLYWMLEGVNPVQRKERSTIWGQYEKERNHYADPALAFKRKVIENWLERLKPEWVLDVGCNAGEFSELAVSGGANAICWDGDPQALATLCERHANTSTARHYFPILCPIDDASGGRGWMGNEFPSLIDRLDKRVDVVMLLAVTHHLVIAGGVRLEDIFRFAARISKRVVLVELLSEKDVRVIQLCLQFDRNPSEFTLEKQHEAAAAAGFRCKHHKKLSPEDTREYVWLEHDSVFQGKL